MLHVPQQRKRSLPLLWLEGHVPRQLPPLLQHACQRRVVCGHGVVQDQQWVGAQRSEVLEGSKNVWRGGRLFVGVALQRCSRLLAVLVMGGFHVGDCARAYKCMQE